MVKLKQNTNTIILKYLKYKQIGNEKKITSK